jgi:ethanolamine-phosphate cytidylyltransferase
MALFPSEASASIADALEALFEMPEAQEFFANASPRQRAECAARHLCGVQQPWQVDPPSPPRSPAKSEKSIRILLTGCFDLMHAGHYNALRQAKAAYAKDGYTNIHLVAGVHSDKAIAGQKGPPVIPHSERVELVKACKWVDSVAADLPYAVPVKLLDDLGCDCAVHGDDLPKVGSGGLFDEVMRAGRLRIVKRTEGTSTTELIGRLMSMSREHQMKSAATSEAAGAQALVSDLARPDGYVAKDKNGNEETLATKPVLLPTISRLVDFHNQYGDVDASTAKSVAGRRVVYVPGVWDLFHVGHARFLEKARELGDFVLVGCLGDDVVNRRLGRNYPLQAVHERTLALLSCRFVDDVLIGAPWKITQDMLTTMNISVVCHGSTDFWDANGKDHGEQGDPFELPRKLNMLEQRDSGCNVTVHLIAHRICRHAEEYAIRQQKKESEEKKYYDDNKAFVAEA